jgi:hypothetical protein
MPTFLPILKAMVAVSLPLLAACRDGYPTEDEPLATPEKLTREQLVEALNELSEETRGNRRRTYALQLDCELEIKAKKPKGQFLAHLGAHSLNSTSIKQEDDTTYLVTLIPRGGKPDQSITVFESTRWMDRERARTLVQFLQRGCHAASPITRSTAS